MNKGILAAMLAPVLSELELRRYDAAAASEEGRVEFLMRRMAARIMGVDFTYLGMAFDDLIAERAYLAKCKKPGLSDAAAVSFVINRLAYWAGEKV